MTSAGSRRGGPHGMPPLPELPKSNAWFYAGFLMFVIMVSLALAPLLIADLRVPLARTPESVGIRNYESVTLTPTDERISIQGWWFPVSRPRGAVILVHGGGDNRASPYSKHLELAKDLQARNYASLAIDLRNHGESDDTTEGPTFGPSEREDVIAAVEFLKARARGVPVAALGFSMGGNAVVYAAVKDKRIRSVVTSGTYTDFSAVLPAAASAMTGIPAFLMIPVMWSAEMVHGVPISWARIDEVAPRLAEGSLLVIHNEADPIVPVEHARRLAKFAPKADLWITPAPPADHPILAEAGRWGTHVRSFDLYRKEFVDRIVAHFERTLR